MNGFPSLLREIGYYTSNNVKTDYNNGRFEVMTKASWNESSATASWPSTGAKPFFAVHNLMTSHQSRSMVWPREKFLAEVQSKLPPEKIHDPATFKVPPYYVDTPVVRRDQARFYDCVSAMDQEVGQLLAKLEADGLADNTIVFFFADHGSGMPRHKRALLDSGMHVPLMVRFPAKWKQFAPGKPGTTSDRIVSFVDYAPTVLRLVGIKPPAEMQGEPFLGATVAPPRRYAFGHRDRVDEVLDLARSVRGKRFLYIRNFMPHLGYNQRTTWPDRGDIRHEFYRLTDAASMTAAQWHFAGPTRPMEELYDCQVDPMNLNNLAASPTHTRVMNLMREQLALHMVKTRDFGFVPESEAWKLSESSMPWVVRQDDAQYPLVPLIEAASAVGIPDEARFIANLQHENAAVRYWGALGLMAMDSLGVAGKSALETGLKDGSAAVRIECANALCKHGGLEQALPLLIRELEGEGLTSVMHAARTIELLGAKAAAAEAGMQKVLERANTIRPPDLSPVIVLPGEEDMAMFVAFSANAFLEALKGK